MRGLAGFAVVFVVGCVPRPSEPPDDPWVGPPVVTNPPHPGCESDASCSSGQVCARTGACLAPDQVRAIHVSWTVSGMPASSTSCASAPDLQIELDSTSGSAHLAYLPLPCVEGRFSVDKAPISIDKVSLGRAYGGSGWQNAKIDPVTGEASLDLPY